VAVLSGRFRWAGTAIGASDAVLLGIGAIHLPRVEIDRARSLRTIRQALGDQATDATLLVGRGMTTEDMIASAEACAREILDEPPHSDAVDLAELSAPDLTPREHDVVQLLAAGYTNREIGEVLSLGHRTVATHVSNLLAKFGVATRSAAAGEAVRLGLAQPQHPPNPET
jgi:DNA-binding NarL/FixJ family response regulator